MAEILVLAKDHWMEKTPQEERDKWDSKTKDKFNRRVKKGSPIVVKPDGWVWGKEECPPNYIVVKVPDISVEEAQKYIRRVEQDQVVLQKTGKFMREITTKKVKHRRRYQLDPTVVDAAIAVKGNLITTRDEFEQRIQEHN